MIIVTRERIVLPLPRRPMGPAFYPTASITQQRLAIAELCDTCGGLPTTR
jgi:hypothetical protein